MTTAFETVDSSFERVDTTPRAAFSVWEALSYAVILGVATGLRFYQLAAAPLSLREAAQALAAWEGQAMPSGGSPLLFALNQLLIGVFGLTVDEAGLRLGAAVCGTILVMLPWLFRRQIGRYGAVGAALMLAVSPTLVLASRTLDGQIVAATCALAALGFGLRYLAAQRAIDLIGSAISIGLLLASGPGLVTIALALLPALLIVYRWFASEADQMTVKQLRADTHLVRQAVVWGGVVLIAGATGLLLRPSGLANVPESISAWLGAWGAPALLGPLSLLPVLLFYEPLLVWFGLAGGVLAARRLSGVPVVLLVWAGVTLLIAVLQPGRQVLDVVLVLPPLALLGGLAVEAVMQQLVQHGSWQREGLFCLAVAVLLIFIGIRASNTAMGVLVIEETFLGVPLSLALTFSLGVVLIVLVVVGIAVVAMGWQATVRAVAMTLFVVFALMSLSGAWRVTQRLPSDPRELLWGPTATTLEVRALREALQAASKRNTGTATQVPIALTLPQADPVVQWYLRDFPNVRINGAISEMAPVLVAPLGSEFPPYAASDYLGKRFTIRSTWDSSLLSNNDLMRWWLYRESDVAPTPLQSMVVWVKTGQAGK